MLLVAYMLALVASIKILEKNRACAILRSSLAGPTADLELPAKVPSSQRDVEGQLGMVTWRKS